MFVRISPAFRSLFSRQPFGEWVRNPHRNLSCILIPPLSSKSQSNQIVRFKSRVEKSKIPKHISETESEESSDMQDDLPDKSTRTLKANVSSMRMDAILKAGLGLSRNKIEHIFYESKVRLNGEKVPKKSVSVRAGDEIDVIKGVSISNPNFLVVARLELLSAEVKEEIISVKMRICKSLTIENYSSRNSWEP